MLTSKINIIGHRGAAGLEFENTLAGISKAITLGVDCIEIDVWKTTDGELVVFHDTYLDRLTPHSGFIKNFDSEQLSAIKLNNGDNIPTLKAVINLIKPHNVQLLVEIKDETATELSYQLLKSNLDNSRFIIGSFYHEPMMNLKLRDADLQTAIMFENVPVDLNAYLQKVNCDYAVTSIETYNRYLIDTVNALGIKLLFYTVNTLAEIELAISAKPYGIITNFPDILIGKLRQ